MPFVFPKKNAFGALIAAHYFFLSLFPLTAQTPTRLSQANAGGGNSFGYEQSLVINDQYFFYGSTPATGVELWVSDGTVAGTRLVKDINPGTGSGASAIAGAAFKNKIWFQGKTPESGTELWCSDGQENGTKMIETVAGSVDEQGNLTNEQDLLNHLVPKVQDFAEYYLVNMSLSRPVNFQEVSRHLGGASREITSLFINCLKTTGTNPNSQAYPQNYNPPPTPPGEPYENIKFTSRQVAEDIKRQIEEWINRQ